MRTFAFAVVVAFAACVVAAPVPPPSAREVAQLVEKLGSPNFREREAATQRLDELGELALEELRVACKSEDPEVAERAKDLVRKIERRAASDRLIPPTLVELNAKNSPIDEVLAILSKQAGCEVVLGGLKPDELAAKKISITMSKVPFWNAVLKVCDAGELQVAGVSGFIAPGSMPYYPRAKRDGVKARVAVNPDFAVVLEARGASKRPASVHGAILVEAIEPPKGTAKQPSAMLQLWPEPKIDWQSVARVTTTRAVDADGRKFTPDVTTPRVPEARKPVPGGVIGGDIIKLGEDKPIPQGADFTPNVRQAVVRFKSNAGTKPLARELTGSAFGYVRGSVEPLATVALDPTLAVATSGQGGVEMTATERTEKGKRFINVKLSYDSFAVVPARTTDDLGQPDGTGNKTTLGVQVIDANDKAFETSLSVVENDFDRTNPRRFILDLKLELVIAKDGPTKPAKVVFWGSIPKPVEVPFALKDVPLVGGR